MMQKSFHQLRRAASRCAILFDLDGTLIDSLDDIASALNQALERHALPRVSGGDTRQFIGEGVTTLCRRAAPGADDATIESMPAAFYDIYRHHCTRATTLYDGIRETLDLLADSGIPMGVVSNKPHEFTRQIVAALCPSRWFATVHGATGESDRKPRPTMALAAADALRRAPRDTLFVGDSSVDIETARNADMLPIGVTWGFRDEASLRDAGAMEVIHAPEELIAVICQNCKMTGDY